MAISIYKFNTESCAKLAKGATLTKTFQLASLNLTNILFIMVQMEPSTVSDATCAIKLYINGHGPLSYAAQWYMNNSGTWITGENGFILDTSQNKYQRWWKSGGNNYDSTYSFNANPATVEIVLSNTSQNNNESKPMNMDLYVFYGSTAAFPTKTKNDLITSDDMDLLKKYFVSKAVLECNPKIATINNIAVPSKKSLILTNNFNDYIDAYNSFNPELAIVAPQTRAPIQITYFNQFNIA